MCLCPRLPVLIGLLAVALLQMPCIRAETLTPPRVTAPAGPLRVGEKIEWTVADLPDAVNPFDPAVIRVDAEIVSPGGQTVSVPGFAVQCCESHQVNGETRYQSIGGLDWRVRYAAPSTGEYHARVVVTVVNADRAVSAPFRFQVEPPVKPYRGIVRISPDNPAAFACADGSGFIPVGENICWQTPRDKIFGWIAKLGASKANWVRIWTSSSPTFGLEGTRAYEYNEDAARALDAVVENCERNGVCATFCLSHVRSFGPPPRPPKAINYSSTFPYDVRNGGPAVDMREMFTLPAARAQQEAMLRYVIARWGYSRAIFAWELWNEMDSIRDNAAMHAEIVRWVDEMCSYLHAHDPYGHLATTSLGSAGVWEDLWRLPSVDFINYHDYGGREKYRDRSQVEVYAPVMANLGKYGKPVLFSEVGLVNEDWNANDHVSPKKAATAIQDVDNRAFHEALWLPFFTGAAGGGLHWWWEELDYYNVYSLYQTFADFIADVPLARAPMPTVDGRASAESLRCFARGNDWGTLAWVWDRRAAWQSLVLAARQPEKVTGAYIILPAAQGTFQVQCVDTRDGKELSRSTIQSDPAGLTVPLPEFTVDVAVKAVRISRIQ